MRRVLRAMEPFLRLTRVTGAFAAVANVWFVVLWTRAIPDERAFAAARFGSAAGSHPLWLELLGSAVAALGLYAFGTGLNDVLDWRRDRHFRPDRPLPAGQVSLARATSLIACTLIAAVLGSTVFGITGVLVTLGVTACILWFNAAAKFIPAIGFVVLGVIYAGHMLVPNPHLRFLWPAWLVMTHTLVLAGVTHAMSRKVPALSRRALAAAILAWVCWTALLAYGAWVRGEGQGLWPDALPNHAPIFPALLVALFLAYAARKIAIHGRTPRTADKLWRYGSLWLQFYACAWLGAAGLVPELAIMGAWTLAGLLAVTLAREAFGLLERPLGYRW